MLLALSCVFLLSACSNESINNPINYPTDNSAAIKEPKLTFDPPIYTFIPKQYDDPEYDLPLSGLPENYGRDIMQKFQKTLTPEQKDILLKNGVIILPGDKDRFDNAYRELGLYRTSDPNDTGGVPIFITTDSVMHLFHIEFNELLKNIEMKKLIPLLNDFLDKTLEKSIEKYNGMKDPELKELARRNVAYLSVAKKLLDDNYDVPSYVRDDVNKEILRIENHSGMYENELFSKDCNAVCTEALFPQENDKACNLMTKGTISYEGKQIYFPDLYRDVCSKSCYCEDYSQYVPRGHYTSTEELKRYFKSMMWLGRITFRVSGEGWTKQAVLLTDTIKEAKTSDEWNKLYSVTAFFAGASDDLTIKDYDDAILRLYNMSFDESQDLKEQITSSMQSQLSAMRGPKILGDFSYDISGNLQENTRGLRIIGQRYAIDSQILTELTYDRVGPNPSSSDYGLVLDTGVQYKILTQPKEFYYSCDNMSLNKTKYWNEVCNAAVVHYCGGQCGSDTPLVSAQKIYEICRFMPSGLDVMSVLGSLKASEIIVRKNIYKSCDYVNQSRMMQYAVLNYSQSDWNSNLYNSWLWMMQPVIREKSGYPNWMQSELYKTKELVTALSSWAELRHDTILYVKQSYTSGVTMQASALLMPSKYYGYVEPNPELYARAKFLTDYMLKGLDEQGMLTDDVKKSLGDTSDMMARLQEISDKELSQENLTEEDYNYIEGMDTRFRDTIQDFASALTIEENKKPIVGINVETHTFLEGQEDAFKTSMIADVHTDVNTQKALEVGTGYIDWIIVAHKSKDGTIGLAVGPIFSYYEFPQPMSDRLTDEKWRALLPNNPARPDWG